MTILNDIKPAVGVGENNLGFDDELLLHINSIKSSLVQMGLSEYELIEIEAVTDWPTLSNETLNGLVKQYFSLKARELFDPIPSETIAKTMANAIMQLEGRISHEIEEVASNV